MTGPCSWNANESSPPRSPRSTTSSAGSPCSSRELRRELLEIHRAPLGPGPRRAVPQEAAPRRRRCPTRYRQPLPNAQSLDGRGLRREALRSLAHAGRPLTLTEIHRALHLSRLPAQLPAPGEATRRRARLRGTQGSRATGRERHLRAPLRRRELRHAYSLETMSAMSSPASVGLCPTLTPGVAQRLHLGRRGALAARDDGAGVAHLLARQAR